MGQADFKVLYAPASLRTWDLPAAIQVEPEDGQFRAPRLCWPPALDRAAAPSLWIVCCDVLVLEHDMLVDRPTFVFARRIERGPAAGIVIDASAGDGAELQVLTQEIVQADTGTACDLVIEAVRPDGAGATTAVPYRLSPGADRAVVGCRWAGLGDAQELQPSQIPTEFLDVCEPLQLSLATIFQIATLLSTAQPELAMAQLGWVGRLAAAHPQTNDLAAQAANLADSLLARKALTSGVVLVPRLDPEVYASQAQAMAALLGARQESWERLQALRHGDGQWCALAKAALEEHRDHRELAEKLEAQARASRDQAVAAREAAVRELGYQRMQLHVCKGAFDVGVEAWKRQQQTEAAIKLALGVGDLLWQIGKMAAAGPEFSKLPVVDTLKGVAGSLARWSSNLPRTNKPAGGELALDPVDLYEGGGHEPHAGKAAAPAAPAAPAARKPFDVAADAEQRRREETQQQLGEGLAEMGKDGMAILDAAMRIDHVAKQAQAMEQSSQTLCESAERHLTQAFQSTSLAGLDVVTGGDQQWEQLATQVDDVFEQFEQGVLLAIEGGQAYRTAFRQLMLCGRSLCRARLAVATATSHLVEMMLQRHSAARSAAIAAALEQNMAQSAARTAAIEQRLFAGVLDAKRAVYLALEAHCRAFEYFTLSPAAPGLPRMTDSVDAFRLAVARTAGRELVPATLGQAPQTLEEVEVRCTDPDLLRGLKEGGMISWTLKADGEELAGYARVRIDRVRVFAEGLPPGRDVRVDIETTGAYEDRSVDGQVRSFAGPPMHRRFAYRHQVDGKDTITVDGDISYRYSRDFFLPTPFTTWSLTVCAPDGRPLNLAPLTGLRMCFHGEATPSNGKG